MFRWSLRMIRRAEPGKSVAGKSCHKIRNKMQSQTLHHHRLFLLGTVSIVEVRGTRWKNKIISPRQTLMTAENERIMCSVLI